MTNSTRPSGILIIAEYSGGRIHPVSFELTGKGMQLNNTLHMPLYCVAAAPENAQLDELCLRGADKVYHISSDCFIQPEENLMAMNLIPFIRQLNPEIVLVGATQLGRSLAPRLACALETGLTADCTDLQINEDGEFIQVRPAFSDNILAHIKTVTSPKISTVRYREFPEPPADTGRRIDIEKIPPYCTEFSGCRITESSPASETDISDAHVIVAAGRGLRSADDMKMIEDLAEVLGGRVGVSRALVDAGIADSSIQIGYSGHRVKPQIYIACGISGAPQHLAGMKESDIIIAINKDPSAPVFRIADYGFVGDIYEVVPYLTEYFRKEKK